MGDRIDDALLQPGVVARRVWRVLRELCRPDDVRDLRQGAVCGLGVESVKRQALEAALEESGGGRWVLELGEPDKRIVVEIVRVLLHLPGDILRFVDVGDRFPS